MRREIRAHRKTNEALQQRGDPLLYRVLSGILRGWFLCVVIIIYILLIFLPVDLLSSDYLLPRWLLGSHTTTHRLAELLQNANGYFLTAQVALIAVVFPVAIALVSLVTQRAHASTTNAHIRIYYDDALATRVGLSGVALLTLLLVQLVAPALLPPWSNDTALPRQMILCCLNLLWLVINALSIWHFLRASLSFIDPSGRKVIRERFAANRSLPSYFQRELFLALHRIAATRLLPELDADEHRVGIYFGGLFARMDGNEIRLDIGRDRALVDLYGWPLRFALRRWFKRSRPLLQQGFGVLRLQIALAFPLEPFAPMRGSVVICRQRGAELTRLERWLVQHAFRFGRVVPDRAPEPKAILEELADEVMGQVERNAVIGFEESLGAMVDCHRFLFDASVITDDSGDIRSLSEMAGFWGPVHEEWLDSYRRIIERTIAMLDREDEFFRHVIHLPHALMPRDLRHAPSAPVIGSFRLVKSAAAGLQRWAARRRLGKGSDATLPAPDSLVYRPAIRALIHAWFNLVQRADYYFHWHDSASSKEDKWHTLTSSWPFLFNHLWGTAWLLALALWNNDREALERYAELMVRWPGNLRHDLDLSYAFETELITPSIFQSNKIACLCDHAHISESNLFAEAIKNAWEDMLWNVAAITLRWRLSGHTDVELSKSTIKLLCRGQPEEKSVMQETWAHSHAFQRLFHSLIRPVIAGGRYAEKGYAAELSGVLSSIDNLSEPEPFPANIWTPNRIHQRDDLRFAFEALLLFLVKDAPEEASRIEGKLDLIENFLGNGSLGELERVLHDVRSDLTSHRTLLERFLNELGSDTSYDTDSAKLIRYLDAWIEPVRQRREHRIRSAEISEAKLKQIRDGVDNALINYDDELEPFQPAVRRTSEPAERYPFKITGVLKAHLIEGPMADSWNELPEHIGNLVANYSRELALNEVLRNTREVEAATAGDYERVLLDQGAKLRTMGFTPILLARSHKDPVWLDELIDASEDQRRYSVGQINGTQLVISRWPRDGTSLLVAREALKEILYQEDDRGAVVTMVFEPDEEDPWHGSLYFEFGQRVVLADVGPVSLVFGRN